MPTDNVGLDLTLISAADFATKQYFVVSVNSAGKAALADADDLNQIGVIQNNPPSGQATTIRTHGVTKAVYGGTVAAGARVTSDADGKIVAAATGKQVIGIALVAGVSGDIGKIYFDPRQTAA